MTQAGIKVHDQSIPGLKAGEAIGDYVKRLQAENEALRANKGSSIKVSTKGAVSVYGMGRWPVTLYRSQWEKLFAMSEQILNFIKANEKLLKVKED